MQVNKVVVVGSANTDMVVKSERFPAPGETILGGEFFMFPGGKGANQAVAAARMGAETSFICALGDDLFGRKALEGYAEEGLDTTAVMIVPDVASGIALITVNAAGENEIVVASGANAHLDPSWLKTQAALLKTSDLVLAQLEIPMPAIAFLAAFCKDRKVPMILNPAPACVLPDELLAGLYALTPNQSETEFLTGIAVRDSKTAQQASDVLRDKGVLNVVITMGSAGAYYSGTEGSFLVNARQVSAVDTTAAGDVFNGVLASWLARGMDWRSSLEQAASSAAISVTRMGAQSSAPYHHEIQ